MIITGNDVDLFIKLAELSSNITASIIGYLPKCMLPELLSCSSIRKIVASAILSNIEITKRIARHKPSDVPGDGYSTCSCQRFRITLTNLKEGVRQWSMFPSSIYIHDAFIFETVLDFSPELFMDALSISGCFMNIEHLNIEALLRCFLNSKFMFDSLSLSRSHNPFALPPVATNVKLYHTRLNSFVIPGVKKLELHVAEDQEERLTFSADLEDLIIYTNRSIQMTLPPNLRKLDISAFNSLVNFISQQMVNLENLLLTLPNIQTFNATGITAPNLKTLFLQCDLMNNLDDLRQFQRLNNLVLKGFYYPIGLFNEGSFPELEKFRCWECFFPDSEDFDNSLLTFPPNLKELEINVIRFQNVNISSSVFPSTLTRLTLANFSFNYDYLGDNLQYIDVRTSKLIFKSDFRIPQMAKEFSLNASYLTFESMDFMYPLPADLVRLDLFARELGKINPITQMVEWPLKMSEINFKNFNIDYFKLKQLNLNESGLTKIYISGGDVKKLNAGLFPVSVKDLSLTEMGIQQLPDSFENLKNLQKLSLQGNQLREVTSVKLPMAMLETLDVNQCNLRLISPFVVSMLEEKNKNAKLRVYARGNLNVSVIDIRKTLKAIKGLSLDLSNFDNTLIEIANRSSRLRCIEEPLDPYIVKSKTDDLYNGSESSLDQESGGTKKKRRNI